MEKLLIPKTEYCKKCNKEHTNIDNEQYCHVYLMKRIKAIYNNTVCYNKDAHLFMSCSIGGRCYNCCDNYFFGIEPYFFPNYNGMEMEMDINQGKVNTFFHYIYHLECVDCKDDDGTARECKCSRCKCKDCKSRTCSHLKNRKPLNKCKCRKCGIQYNNILLEVGIKNHQCVTCNYLNGRQFPCEQREKEMTDWDKKNMCEYMQYLNLDPETTTTKEAMQKIDIVKRLDIVKRQLENLNTKKYIGEEYIGEEYNREENKVQKKVEKNKEKGYKEKIQIEKIQIKSKKEEKENKTPSLTEQKHSLRKPFKKLSQKERKKLNK